MRYLKSIQEPDLDSNASREPGEDDELGEDMEDLTEYTKPNGRRARRVPPATGEALEVKSSMVQGRADWNCSACEAISPRASLSSLDVRFSISEQGN
jgi:hypothetical protein